MERIPASERTREKLKAVIEGTSEGSGTSELISLAAWLIIEEALEGEARDALGREYYARGAAPGAGYRNDYRTGRLDSRDLSEFAVLYLFIDGLAERLHLGQPREAVLAAWGILADGKKTLLHLAPGTKEDTASCREFFRDMRRRGLPDPLLVVSDGAPVIIRAIEECFPRALRQRCLAHKMRNLASKLPENVWPEFKARVQGPRHRLLPGGLATGQARGLKAHGAGAVAARRHQDDLWPRSAECRGLPRG